MIQSIAKDLGRVTVKQCGGTKKCLLCEDSPPKVPLTPGHIS